MANMLALNTVYNHYLTTYSNGTVSKYDTHKKSELRGIYNSIVKLNKESPLFLPETGLDSQAFAVGIKEGARTLHNIIASLGGLDENELLNKKAAFSTDENIVSAQYIGNFANAAEIPSYNIEVKSLASPQENMGYYLPSDKIELSPGTYSFDINIHNMNYEFQYNITENDTNKSVQEKLARLISGSDIGISASVDENDDMSSLKLSSMTTGVPYGKDSIFTVSDAHSSKTSGSVDYFGIGDTTHPSANANLIVNGIERSVSSNHFTLEKTYELTLNGISPVEGQTATIDVKNDTESLSENIGKLIDGYNSFMETALQRSGEKTKNSTLIREMKNIASLYGSGLNSLGLSIEDNGTLSIDKDAYQKALSKEDVRDTLSNMKEFADSLLRKANQVSLNPMQYINKTIVAYKNPGHNFATPYITSAYSGMMFNSYC